VDLATWTRGMVIVRGIEGEQVIALP